MCASQGGKTELVLPEKAVYVDRQETGYCIHELFERQVGAHSGSGGPELRRAAAELP